jgi:hypothetical protein
VKQQEVEVSTAVVLMEVMLNEAELSSQNRLGCLCGDQVCFGRVLFW